MGRGFSVLHRVHQAHLHHGGAAYRRQENRRQEKGTLPHVSDVSPPRHDACQHACASSMKSFLVSRPALAEGANEGFRESNFVFRFPGGSASQAAMLCRDWSMQFCCKGINGTRESGKKGHDGDILSNLTKLHTFRPRQAAQKSPLPALPHERHRTVQARTEAESPSRVGGGSRSAGLLGLVGGAGRRG